MHSYTGLCDQYYGGAIGPMHQVQTQVNAFVALLHVQHATCTVTLICITYSRPRILWTSKLRKFPRHLTPSLNPARPLVAQARARIPANHSAGCTQCARQKVAMRFPDAGNFHAGWRGNATP